MLFTAGLSVMYCTSVSKTIAAEDLRASYGGLLRCRELLTSVAKQLPDSKNYVSVFEALLRDVSQRLWPKESESNLPADASLAVSAGSAGQIYSNDLGNFANEFPQHIVTDSLPSDVDNMSNFATGRDFFDQSVLGPVNQFTAPMQADNDINPEGINWALMNYDSLWNMESALGQYVYGDPTNTGVWEGFEF
ncbi:hypothetical protein ACHAPO_009581 [Fusarium lateritium]